MKQFVLSIVAFSLIGCSSLHSKLSEPAIVEQPGEQVVLRNTVLCQHDDGVVVEGDLKGNKAFQQGRSIQVFVYSAEGKELEKSVGCVKVSSHPESRQLRRWHRLSVHTTAWFRIPLSIVPPANGRVVVLPLEQECKKS